MDDPSIIMPLSAECHTLKAYCKWKSDGNWQDCNMLIDKNDLAYL